MKEFKNYLRSERQLSKVTIGNYLFLINQFQKFLSQTSEGLNMITRQDISNFLNYLQNKGNVKSSINLYIIALRNYYKWAYSFYKDEELSRIVFFLYHKLKIEEERKAPVIPTREEISKLRSALNQFLQLNSYDKNSRFYRYALRAYTMIEIFITAGLRSKELKSLQRKDIDLESRIIFVKKRKGDYQRFSLCGESTIEVLKEYFEVYKFAPEDIIFPMAQQNVVNRTVKRWATNAQINPRIVSHSLRLYFITQSKDLMRR